MITLALIPAAALLLIVFFCLRAKQMYALACQTIHKQAEEKRQKILAQDLENDERLVCSVIVGNKSLGDLISELALSVLSSLFDMIMFS